MFSGTTQYLGGLLSQFGVSNLIDSRLPVILYLLKQAPQRLFNFSCLQCGAYSLFHPMCDTYSGATLIRVNMVGYHLKMFRDVEGTWNRRLYQAKMKLDTILFEFSIWWGQNAGINTKRRKNLPFQDYSSLLTNIRQTVGIFVLPSLIESKR